MTTKPVKHTQVDKPRNRLTPIPNTLQSIRGYPSKLVIYKTDASKYFWTRTYFNNRYYYKSTKTESLQEAQKFAIKFYEQVLINAHATHTSDKSRSFTLVATRYFNSVEKSAKSTVLRTDISRYKNDLLPTFGEQEVNTITNSQISALIEKLHERDLRPATIKHFLVVLRKILKFAIANDLMTHMPVFPKVAGRLTTTQKRDYLTTDEYNLIVKTAEKAAKDKVTVRGILITDEMKYLIQFMVNSFIRPSDIRVLQHKHIKTMKEGADHWLALSHPATKTNATIVQAMPASVHIYKRLLAFRKSQNLHTTLDDYVFMPQYENRDTAIDIFSRLFKRIVELSLIESKTGKKLTLYSLRHTAIMLRLVIGKVDSLALARNARTSQAMIDKFYAAHLTTHQVRKQLHAFPDAEEKERTRKPSPLSKKAAQTSAKTKSRSSKKRSKPVLTARQ